MPFRIDNPGGGDCGFYAFSIGLINAVQEEYNKHSKSKTFDLWRSKGLNNVILQEILDIDLHKLYDSPYTYKKETLLKLQMSLRSISATAYKNDLLKKIADAKSNGSTQVESSPVYHKFMELVHYYLKDDDKKEGVLDKIKQFNELALSPEVLDLAQKTAKSLEPKLKDQSFAEKQKIENAHVKEALLADVISGGRENPRSILLKGVEKIEEQGRWATHSDLNKIAGELKVNLYVTNQVNGALMDGWSTIALNNEGNSTHWTTNVEKLPEPKAKPIEKERIESSKSIKETHTSPKDHESSKIRESSKDRETRVIAATVSTQINEKKAERYQQHIKTLVHAASTQGLFANVKNKIENIDKLDNEEALKNEHGDQIESDEEFAMRLQEAEFRRANLK